MEKHWVCLRSWWEGRFGWGMGGFITGSVTAGAKEMPKKSYLPAENPSLFPNQGNKCYCFIPDTRPRGAMILPLPNPFLSSLTSSSHSPVRDRWAHFTGLSQGHRHPEDLHSGFLMVVFATMWPCLCIPPGHGWHGPVP